MQLKPSKMEDIRGIEEPILNDPSSIVAIRDWGRAMKAYGEQAQRYNDHVEFLSRRGEADHSIEPVCEAVAHEVRRATSKHPSLMASLHEARSIIQEEFREFCDEMELQTIDPDKVREELIQTAAMCVRAICELGHNGFAGNK